MIWKNGKIFSPDKRRRKEKNWFFIFLIEYFLWGLALCYIMHCLIWSSQQPCEMRYVTPSYRWRNQSPPNLRNVGRLILPCVMDLGIGPRSVWFQSSLQCMVSFLPSWCAITIYLMKGKCYAAALVDLVCPGLVWHINLQVGSWKWNWQDSHPLGSSFLSALSWPSVGQGWGLLRATDRLTAC